MKNLDTRKMIESVAYSLDIAADLITIIMFFIYIISNIKRIRPFGVFSIGSYFYTHCFHSR